MSELNDPAVPISDRMQSLLAQAAEEQLSEQRQLARAVVEMREQLGRITADVSALRDGADTGGRVDSAVGAVSAEVREAVRLIGERLDSLARMVHQRGLDIAELRGSFGELRNSVVAHGDALNGLTGGMHSLPAYGERVTALQETVAALSERMGGLDDVRAAVADVDRRVGTTADALVTLQSGVDSLATRIQGLAAAGDLDATAAQVAAVSDQIESLAASTTPLAQGVLSLQDSLRLETERNARLTDQLSDLYARIDAVAAAAAEARSDGDRLTQRLDGMQEDITAIGGNVAGLVEAGPDPVELADALQAARSAGASQSERIEQISSQLGELRGDLAGPDGVEARLGALADRMAARDAEMSGPSLDGRIESAVAAAMASSEERLTRHLDEAVLALAEVLLRRRPGRVGSALARLDAEPPVVRGDLTADADLGIAEEEPISPDLPSPVDVPISPDLPASEDVSLSQDPLLSEDLPAEEPPAVPAEVGTEDAVTGAGPVPTDAPSAPSEDDDLPSAAGVITVEPPTDRPADPAPPAAEPASAGWLHNDEDEGAKGDAAATQAVGGWFDDELDDEVAEVEEPDFWGQPPAADDAADDADAGADADADASSPAGDAAPEPAAVPEQAGSAEPAPGRKRRPWWRPGD